MWYAKLRIYRSTDRHYVEIFLRASGEFAEAADKIAQWCCGFNTNAVHTATIMELLNHVSPIFSESTFNTDQIDSIRAHIARYLTEEKS